MVPQLVLDRGKVSGCGRNVEQTQLPNNRSWHKGCWPLVSHRGSPLEQQRSLLDLEPGNQRC
jgi:hypothetical protein